MKDFLDLKLDEREQYFQLTDSFYDALVEEDLDVNEINEEVTKMLTEAGIDVESLDEGLIGSLIGGIAGFFIGPKIGKVVANALGVEKGILYDMFTSKLVGAALGAAISKYLSGGRRRRSKK